MADPVRALQREILQELLKLLREGGTRSALRSMLRSKDAKTQREAFTMLFDTIAKMGVASAQGGIGGGDGGVRIFLGSIPRPEPTAIVDARVMTDGSLPRPGGGNG